MASLPPFVLLLCDGGSDESPSKISFIFLLLRLWLLFDLDILAAVTYCPGDSKLNPIERLWALVTGLFGADALPMNNSLALKELRSWLDGESCGQGHRIQCAISDPDFSDVPTPCEGNTEIAPPVSAILAEAFDIDADPAEVSASPTGGLLDDEE